jgi:hypothetical protein
VQLERILTSLLAQKRTVQLVLNILRVQEVVLHQLLVPLVNTLSPTHALLQHLVMLAIL